MRQLQPAGVKQSYPSPMTSIWLMFSQQLEGLVNVQSESRIFEPKLRKSADSGVRSRGAAIVQIRGAGAHTPQRRGAPLVAQSRALPHLVGKGRSHIVQQQVGVKRYHLARARTC